jgi:type IV pilus assembly protein PilO
MGINKLPWYGQVLLFVVLSAAGLYAFKYFYADEREAVLVTRQAELDGVRVRITKAMAVARQLPAFEAEVKQLEGQLESLKAVLPEQRDVGEMLRRIQTLAVQSNLVVKNFRPQAVKNQQMHAEWPMTLELDGTYHNLGLFFDRVSKIPRIINVGGIAVHGKDAKAAAEDGSTITASCVATTFVLLPDKPAAKAAATPGAPAQNGAAAR